MVSAPLSKLRVSEPNVRLHLETLISRVDRAVYAMGRLFSVFSSICLVGMLLLTAATIVLRPFDVSAYWIFPWIMVLFVWLSFFGFFAAMVMARDIRIDFVAKRMGARGMVITRVIGQIVMLFVLHWLLRELPDIVLKQAGKVDGALLPWGDELHRRYLSLPLLLSCIGVGIAVVLDICKLLVGLPERLGGDMHGLDQTGRPV